MFTAVGLEGPERERYRVVCGERSHKACALEPAIRIGCDDDRLDMPPTAGVLVFDPAPIRDTSGPRSLELNLTNVKTDEVEGRVADTDVGAKSPAS